VSVGVGELWTAGRGVALGVVRGGGVALGTSNRKRRCDTVGEAAVDEAGVEVANGVDVGSTVAAFLGVIFGSGVDDANGVGDCSDGVALRGVIVALGVDVVMGDGVCVADIVTDGDGVGVDAADVDVAEVSPL
jgi:hypothetical protein